MQFHWPLTSAAEVALPSPYATLSFNAGRGVDSLRFSEAFGAMAGNWNTDNLDPRAYYEYTLSPAPGIRILVKQINLEVSLSRLNMRSSVQYSYDGFTRQKTQIGYTVYVATHEPRNLPLKTSLSVTYPQTLSIRVYGWSTADYLVRFHNRNVILDAQVFGRDLLVNTPADTLPYLPTAPEIEPVTPENLAAMPETEVSPDLPPSDSAQTTEPLAAMGVLPPQETLVEGGTGGDRAILESQEFNSSGSFSVPDGVNCLKVECWGAGGGGSSRSEAAGGGGGGAYTLGIIPNPGASITVTVGNGGSSGNAGGNSGAGGVIANGGSSTNSRTGGAGGAASAITGNVITSYSGGNGGNARDNTFWYNNEGGGGGGGSATTTANGGAGGNAGSTGGTGGTGTGNGGRGADGDGNPDAVAGSAPGGGGGGRGEGSSSSKSGANGRVIISYCNIFDITPGGAFCQGSSVTIGLLGSETGVNYQLYRNSTTLVETFTGTGSSFNFTNQTLPGSYTVVAIMIVGSIQCSSDMNGSVIINEQPTATISSQTNVSCYGGSNGSATVTASGGSSPYSYSWSPSGGTNATASGLAAGVYTVTVTDANSCTATASVTITQPTEFTASITNQTNVSCNGGSNGSATVLASGGTSPYSYSWSPNGGTSATASGLSAGTYTVTVTDANSCITTASVTLTQPAELTASISAQTNVLCYGNSTGSATVTASGGTPSYTYLWSNGATNAIASGLAAGTYTVTVTDANSCTTTASVTITQPSVGLSITASSNSPICQGSTLNLTSSPAGGTPNYTYSWTGPSSFTSTNQNPSITNAQPAASGPYEVTVTDANGCSATSTPIAVIVNPAPLATITPSGPTTFCEGGSVVLTSSPGSGYLWNTGAVTQSITVNTTGSYTVTVTGANSCTATSAPVSVTVNPLPLAITGPDQYIFRGQSTPIGAPAITGHTYSWTSAPAGFTSSQANPTVTPMVTTTYTLVETITATGCTKTNSVTVYVSDRLNISKTTVASPSKPGDLLNYQLTYSNLNTAGAAQNITITDNLPDENLFTYVSSIPAGVYNAAARTLTWTIASLAANNSGTITINGICGRTGTSFGYDPASYYICNGGCTENITNQASIINPESAGSNSNVVNQVTQFCDFTLPTGVSGYIKSATPTTIYYVISITNTGNITDKFTFSYNLNLDGSEYNVAVQAQSLSGVLLTETPWLQPGEAYTFRLAVSLVTGTAPNLQNFSDFLATSYVCNITKTTHIHTITFGGQIPGSGVDMVVTKTASPNPATVGSNLIYTIVVTNIGPDQATNIVVNDVLAPSVTYNSSNPPASTFNAATNTITWQAGSLAPNAAPLIFTVTVTPSCSSVPSVLNRAYVSCKTTNQIPEIDPDNNLFLLTTTVNSNITPPTAAGTTICSGATATLTAEGAASGYNYHWYSAAVGGTLLQTGSTYTTPVLTANATYYVAIFNSNDPVCESSRTAVTVTVLTAPVITLQPLASSICEGQNTSFTIAAQGQVLTYQWEVSNDGGTNWTELTNAGPHSGVQTTTLLVTNAPFSLNGNLYRCKVSTGTCSSTLSNHALLTVYPLPVPVITGDTQVCEGSGGNDYTTEAGMSNYVWEVSAGGSITAGAGTNAITVTWNTQGNQWVSLSYTSPEGCNTASPTVLAVTVNFTPIMIDPSDQSLCNGQQTDPVIFAGTNVTTYHWTNSNISIGLPASGTGDIAAFTAINTGNAAVVATITVTPRHTANGFSCDGEPQTFTITVNPTPTVIATPPSETICSGGSTNIALTSNVSGATFTWTAVLQSGSNTTFNASGSGNMIAEIIVNNSNVPAIIRYIITAAANGCSGPQTIVDVTVYPAIVLNSNPASPVTICTGESPNITLISNISGTIFSWTASLVSGTASGYGNGTGALIDQTLNNTSGADAIIRYDVTGTANSCPSGVLEILVTVRSGPQVSNQTTANVCSDNPIEVILNSSSNGIPAINYEITSINSNGLTASAGPASGIISANGLASDAWTNNTGATINVVYTLIPLSAEGCEGPAFTVTVPILSAPLGTNQSIAICSRIALNHSLLSQIAPPNSGVTFTYTVTSSDQINVEAGPDRTVPSAENIIDSYENKTGVPVTITYTVTPIGTNGCTGEVFLFEAVINPEPMGYSVPGPEFTVCDESTTNILLISDIEGTTFTWTATHTGSVSGYVSPGSGTEIHDYLDVPFLGSGTVTYLVTPISPLGCQGQPFPIIVHVSYVLFNELIVSGTPVNTTFCPGEQFTLNLTTWNTLVYVTRFSWATSNPGVLSPSTGGPVPNPGNLIFGAQINASVTFTTSNTTNTEQTTVLTISANAHERTGFILWPPSWGLGSLQCTGEQVNIPITVNPTPTVNPIDNQIVCAGEDYTPDPFETTVPGTTFSWSYTGPNIGLTPTSGTGNIPTFTAINNGTTNLVANFTVAPTYTGGGVTCDGTSRTFTITVRPSPANPTIAGNTTICYGEQATLTASSTTSGVTFRWYDAPDGNLLFTGNPYTTDPLYTTTNFYVVAYSAATQCESQPVEITVNVQPDVDPGHIAEDQTICYEGDPEPFFGDPATGVGTITYQWQSATGPAWTFIDIAGATNETYDAPAGLTVTTRYRRLSFSTLNGVTCASDPSNEIEITVQSEINSGTIAEDQTVCPGGNPALLTSTSPVSGGTGNPSYVWQYSLDGVNFSDIIPTETGATYDPPAGITQTTWYRRYGVYELNGVLCQAVNPTNSVIITVDDLIDPQIVTCPVSRNLTACSVTDITSPDYSEITATSSYTEFSNATNQGVAVDNCGSIANVTYIDATTSLPGTCPYTVIRTWTIYDDEGNYATCNQTITVDDNTNPVIDCPFTSTQTVVVNTGNTYVHPDNSWDATATDNCPGTITLTAQLSGATTSGPHTTLNGVTFNQGLTTVTWTATDGCGNEATCSFDVQVDGEADIEVVKTGPATITAGQNITWNITVTNLGPAVAPEVILTDNIPVDVVNPEFSTDGGTNWAAWAGTYTYSNLAENDPQELLLRGDVNCDAEDFSNTAEVELTEPFIDPEEDNNTSTVNTEVVNPLDVTAEIENATCPDDGEIDITVTGGTPEYSYAWTGPDGFTSTDEDLTGLASGTYTVIVTDANGCTDTDNWTVISEDTEPPTFDTPGPFDYCVINLISAQYDGQPEPAADIIPLDPAHGNPRRPDWYLIGSGSTELDLTNIADNCCDLADIDIEWVITFDPLIGGTLTGTGQPSLSTPIQLWGIDTNVEVTHTITYTVTDCNGISADPVSVEILVRPRPDVIKNY